MINHQDIPDNIQKLLVVVLGTGLGIEPLAALGNKLAEKKKEGEQK